MRIFKWFFIPRNIFTGTLNSDIRIYIMYCTLGGGNVNKPSALTEVEGKKLKLWCDITVQQKPSLFHPLGPFPSKKDALPLIFLFWSPPTAVHRFDAWDMAVSGLYISCFMHRCQGPIPRDATPLKLLWSSMNYISMFMTFNSKVLMPGKLIAVAYTLRTY